MKKTKNKIIATILAVILVTSVFVVGTVANTKNTAVSVSVDKTTLYAGETATVTVNVTTNYPVATASVPVFYDKTLVTVTNTSANMPEYAQVNVTTDVTATDSDRIYNGTGIDSSKFGFVLANFVGGAGDTVPENLENRTVLTFTVKAKTDVTGDALVKCVTESAKTDINENGMLYFGTTTSGTTITSMPENVENIDVSGASATIKITNATPELVASDGKSGVVDAVNKYVYGITPGDSVENYFEVNNGTLETVANTAGFTKGTGAKVNVKDSGGNVVDTYTVIIFGDVNGDGAITGVDQMQFAQYTGGSTSVLTGAALIAADVNGDGSTTGVDQMSVSQYTSGTTSTIPVNPYK